MPPWHGATASVSFYCYLFFTFIAFFIFSSLRLKEKLCRTPGGEQLLKWDPGGLPSVLPLEQGGNALTANRLVLSWKQRCELWPPDKVPAWQLTWGVLYLTELENAMFFWFLSIYYSTLRFFILLFWAGIWTKTAQLPHQTKSQSMKGTWCCQLRISP